MDLKAAKAWLKEEIAKYHKKHGDEKTNSYIRNVCTTIINDPKQTQEVKDEVANMLLHYMKNYKEERNKNGH